MSTCIASNAVDEEMSDHYLECAHSLEETDPWWRVDMGRVEPVAVVNILNRGDCCWWRLDNSEIRVGRCGYLFQLFECFDYSNVTKFASYHQAIHNYEMVNTINSFQGVVLSWFHIQESQIINKYNILDNHRCW